MEHITAAFIVLLSLVGFFVSACAMLGLFYALEWAWHVFQSLPRP